MRIHLGGHLSWYEAERRSWLDLPAPVPLPLLTLAAQLGLPEPEIALAVINGRQVDLATALAGEGDKVEFYSALGGG